MKSLKKLMLASGAVLALAMGAQAQETVVWWDFLGGGDGIRMKALIEQFNAENTDVQIEGTTLEWGNPFYTKLQTSAAIGEGSDIATYHLSRVPRGVDSNTLSEISDAELSAAGLSDNDYPAAAVAAGKHDGKRYAIPFDVHGLVLYYNKDMLEEAGMIGADGLPTGLDGLDNFNAALAKFTQDDMVGITMPTGDRYRAVYSLFGQMDGEMYNDADGFFPGDNIDKLATATDTVANWVENGWTPEQIESEAALAMFSTGKTPFFMQGVWEIPTFTDLHAKGELFEWGAIQLPVLFDRAAGWSDSHAFVIPNRAGNEVTPEKRAAVLSVIKWMNENSLQWAGAGHIPAYLPVQNSDEFKALKPQSDYADFATHAVFDPRTVNAGPASPLGDAWSNYIVPSTSGEIDPAEAAVEMRDDLNSQL